MELKNGHQIVENTKITDIGSGRSLAILKARAQKIAHRQQKRESQQGFEVFLIFRLNSERYGISLEFIKEVCVLKNLTSFPIPEKNLHGVINVRGEICTVVNLKEILSLADEDHLRSGYVLVMNAPHLQVGLRVDNVLDIQKIPVRDIRISKESDLVCSGKFLKGITKDKVVIVEGKSLLESSSILNESTSTSRLKKDVRKNTRKEKGESDGSN